VLGMKTATAIISADSWSMSRSVIGSICVKNF
jgi:hypothetical protein